MNITLKSKENGDGIFSIELVTQEGNIQLGAYTKSSDGEINTCHGWNMTPFVSKLLGISLDKLLRLVDEGDVIVDVSIKN